jgi:hypothetical protein
MLTVMLAQLHRPSAMSSGVAEEVLKSWFIVV